MQASKLFLVILFISSLGLVSCGGSSNTPTPPVTPKAIEGNWYIAGGQSYTQSPMLTLAMVVNQDAVYGYGDVGVDQNCSNGSSYISNPQLTLSGSESNGTFVMSNGSNFDIQVKIQGTVPQEGSSTWSGTYSITNWSQYSCTFSASNSFVATEIPSLSGTFTGQTVGTNITISTQITQGTVTVDSTSTTMPVYVPLSGNITVGGVSCFTTGTPNPVTASSFITGNDLTLSYIMDDGSTLYLRGSLTDNTASAFYFGVSSTGSKCSSTVDGGGTLGRN